jgi:arylsulfatase A-like enzyme
VIFRLPKALDEGKVYAGMVSGIDIYPTCAGLCQVKVEPSVQGMDLSGAIDTTGGTERKEAYVQWIGRGRFRFGDHPYRALRTRRYTYVVGRDEDFCLLFDNYEDPYQMNNLYHQSKFSSLQETLHLRLVRMLLHAGESRPDFI